MKIGRDYNVFSQKLLLSSFITSYVKHMHMHDKKEEQINRENLVVRTSRNEGSTRHTKTWPVHRHPGRTNTSVHVSLLAYLDAFNRVAQRIVNFILSSG